MLENPLFCHNIRTMRARNEMPSTIVYQSLEFIYHSCSPVWISKCTAIIGQNRRSNNMIN